MGASGLDSFCQQSEEESLNATTNVNKTIDDPATEAALLRLKYTFRTIIVVISALGVAGNILNLVTLRSPSLRNVPFMFIRALALFDLISLTAILLHFSLEWLQIEADPVIFYEVWIQDVLINSFLVAGLYCAVLLTIERFLLIRKPLSTGRRLLSIENTVLVKIGLALLAALLLHAPMALQWQAKCSSHEPLTNFSGDGIVEGVQVEERVGCLHWTRGKFNNRELLCREPFFALYNYYKMGRELLRFFCVLLLVILNAVIARHLQVAKRNRRLLIKRVSMTTTGTEPSALDSKSTPLAHSMLQLQRNSSGYSPNCSRCHHRHHNNNNNCQQHQNAKAANSSPPGVVTNNNSNGAVNHPVERATTPSIGSTSRRDLNSLMRSFTEKKLTALMVAICVIFAIGNIPQMVVMALQNESLENAYSFQVFRQVANTAEVLNHCLNFFIFCMASSEYCRAFLSLGPVNYLLRHFPFCNSLAHARLSGSVRRRLERTHQLMVGVGGGAHRESSALRCEGKNGVRKKSSVGILLTNSDNGSSGGGGTSSWFGTGQMQQQQQGRYRRDNSLVGPVSQRGSSATSCTLMVERKSLSTLTTNAGHGSQEFYCWQVQNLSAAQLQFLGSAAKSTSSITDESCAASAVSADDFL